MFFCIYTPFQGTQRSLSEGKVQLWIHWYVLGYSHVRYSSRIFLQMVALWILPGWTWSLYFVYVKHIIYSGFLLNQVNTHLSKEHQTSSPGTELYFLQTSQVVYARSTKSLLQYM